MAGICGTLVGARGETAVAIALDRGGRRGDRAGRARRAVPVPNLHARGWRT
jgi:hypothetical protein